MDENKIFNFSTNLEKSKDIDPKLWDRLVWQQALEKAIKRKNGNGSDFGKSKSRYKQ